MRLSQYFLPTLKETPADAEIISHQLMLRAGMIRKLSSGIYTWLPLGHRILRKVINVVREEMNRSGAQELLMPAVQPAELWQETKRWDKFGSELLKIKDRNDRDFCFGPTHEEVITDIMRDELKSYKQLPQTFYQIQMKFRDEIRPRFGVMRAREFLMKDAYSFGVDDDAMQTAYDAMYDAYTRIFKRLGLRFKPVLADSGAIGGSMSQEFHVLAETGEDLLVFANDGDYAANIERASAKRPDDKRDAPKAEMEKIKTPGATTINAVSTMLNLDVKKTVKTLIVEGENDPLVALVLRGDHELNTLKAEKLPHIKSPLQFVDEKDVKTTLNVSFGSIGPVHLDIPVIVDHDAAVISDFCCGANEDDYHFVNVNWERDVTLTETHDLRFVQEGDASPDGKGTLTMTRGIEVGHIFQLGDSYSRSMNATVLNEEGKAIPIKMGCYGIGVSRIVAAAIEQNHDENGIIWPDAMAPFQVAIVPMNMHKSYRVREAAEKLYEGLQNAGFEVVLDDRKVRAGVMFADMDLIGVPHRLVVGERGLDSGVVEYQARKTGEKDEIPLKDIVSALKKACNK